MKWIRTTDGDKAHAIFKRHDDKTVCGIRLRHAATIVSPAEDNRCENCDHEWRRQARKNKPKAKPSNDYTSRFTFRDWEES
jgi:hypothetical protein